jgi:hypothetical protein
LYDNYTCREPLENVDCKLRNIWLPVFYVCFEAFIADECPEIFSAMSILGYKQHFRELLLSSSSGSM